MTAGSMAVRGTDRERRTGVGGRQSPGAAGLRLSLPRGALRPCFPAARSAAPGQVRTGNPPLRPANWKRANGQRGRAPGRRGQPTEPGETQRWHLSGLERSALPSPAIEGWKSPGTRPTGVQPTCCSRATGQVKRAVPLFPASAVLARLADLLPMDRPQPGLFGLGRASRFTSRPAAASCAVTVAACWSRSPAAPSSRIIPWPATAGCTVTAPACSFRNSAALSSRCFRAPPRKKPIALRKKPMARS